MSIKTTHGSTLPRILWITAVSLFASLAWTVICGQDVNFDLVTYHFYLGYSGFTSRFDLDYLPAGFYGYQSPLPFMPLYWLDHMGMPPVGIAIAYAAFHALSLVLLYFLTELLVGKPRTGPQHAKVVAFWLLGAIAPVYWTLVGTSFADATTSVLVLAALWMVARLRMDSPTSEVHPMVWVAISGAIIGVSTGARIHNGIFAVGMLCAIAVAGSRYKFAVRATAVFALAAFLGWLLAFAPWGYRLYEEFGNPLFPLFNALFGSPDFPASNVPFISFTPDQIKDLITLPFWMATDTPWIYVELPLPDIRPLLLSIALLAAPLAWLLRRGRSVGAVTALQSTDIDTEGAPSWNRRIVLVFFIVSGVLWLATSANARFGVVLFLLAGPVCGVLLLRSFPARYAIIIVTMAVLWQALLQETFFRQYRFNSIPWTARYFDWNLPASITTGPATLVSFGFQPGSTLAPRLHPGSSHINITGHPAIDAPGNARIKRLIAANRPLYGVVDVSRHGKIDPSAVKAHYNNQARLWGLDFAVDPCDLVALKPPQQIWASFNSVTHMQIRYPPPAFLVCKLQRASGSAHEDAVHEFNKFKDKLSRFGAICPEFFQKPLGYMHTGKGWGVKSLASAELSMEFNDDGRFYLRRLHPPRVTLDLGHVTRDAIVAKDAECKNWFLRISQISAQVARSTGDADPTP